MFAGPCRLMGADFDLPGYDDGDPYKRGEDLTYLHGQGGVDPTAPVDDIVSRAEPFDYAVDSMGRRYPSTASSQVVDDHKELRHIDGRTSPRRTTRSLLGCRAGLKITPLRLRVWWLSTHPTSWIVNAFTINGLRSSSLMLPSSVGQTPRSIDLSLISL